MLLFMATTHCPTIGVVDISLLMMTAINTSQANSVSTTLAS